MNASHGPFSSFLRNRRSRSASYPPMSGPSLAGFLPPHSILTEPPLPASTNEAIEAPLPLESHVLEKVQTDMSPPSNSALLRAELEGQLGARVICLVPETLMNREASSFRAETELFARMWSAIGLTLREQIALVQLHEQGRSHLDSGAAGHEQFWKEWLSQQGATSVEVFVAVGEQAARDVLGSGLIGSSEDFMRRRGQLFSWGSIKVMITEEPSRLLQNPHLKKDSWDDLKKIATLLGISLSSGRSSR